MAAFKPLHSLQARLGRTTVKRKRHGHVRKLEKTCVLISFSGLAFSFHILPDISFSNVALVGRGAWELCDGEGVLVLSRPQELVDIFLCGLFNKCCGVHKKRGESATEKKSN